jgi:hypothetical protein
LKCIYTSLPVPTSSSANGMRGVTPNWPNCINSLSNCNSTQIQLMDVYRNSFVSIITNTSTFHNNGNGAFIHSCYNHCGFRSSNWWNTVKINGVTMQQAVSKWWNSPTSTPSSQNSYLPCSWGNSTSCNPTC